ncbi:hypothetical protein AtNW77_Chr3g0174231 [Arabidopsis thaliana]
MMMMMAMVVGVAMGNIALRAETVGQINEAYKTKPMLKKPLDECNMRYKTIVDVDRPHCHYSYQRKP